MMKRPWRIFYFSLWGVFFPTVLFSVSRLDLQWQRVIAGQGLAPPMVESERIFYVSQDKRLTSLNFSGDVLNSVRVEHRFTPHLLRGDRNGELFITTFNNEIIKILNNRVLWTQRIPFLALLDFALTKDDYLLLPQRTAQLAVISAQDGRIIRQLQLSSPVSLPPISDSWGRFYLATADGRLSAYDSWFRSRWSKKLESKVSVTMIDRLGVLWIALEDGQVQRWSLDGNALGSLQLSSPVSWILQRSDGFLVLISQRGKLTLLDENMNVITEVNLERHVDQAIIFAGTSLFLLAGDHWMNFNEDLFPEQIFPDQTQAHFVNAGSKGLVVIDIDWVLHYYRYNSPHNYRYPMWFSSRGDYARQGKVLFSEIRFFVTHPREQEQLKEFLNDQGRPYHMEQFLSFIEKKIQSNKSPPDYLIGAVVNILHHSLQRRLNGENYFVNSLDQRLKIYPLLAKLNTPEAQVKLVEFGNSERDLLGIIHIIRALGDLGEDPQGISFQYMNSALKKNTADVRLSREVLSSLRKLYAKTKSATSREDYATFLRYILRQNYSRDIAREVQDFLEKLEKK